MQNHRISVDTIWTNRMKHSTATETTPAPAAPEAPARKVWDRSWLAAALVLAFGTGYGLYTIYAPPPYNLNVQEHIGPVPTAAWHGDAGATHLTR